MTIRKIEQKEEFANQTLLSTFSINYTYVLSKSSITSDNSGVISFITSSFSILSIFSSLSVISAMFVTSIFSSFVLFLFTISNPYLSSFSL